MAIVLALCKEDLLVTFVPIAVYWIVSGIYTMFENFHDYRLHTNEEEEEAARITFVSKSSVAKELLLAQFIQIVVSFLVLMVYRKDSSMKPVPQPSLHIIFLQIFVAMVVMDSWSYFVHRMMHANSFMYKHVHSKHHTLVAPYALGALYTHPIEGLIMNTGGGVLSFLISGMTPRTAMFFLSFTTIKTIDDHSSLWFPGNILHSLFSHNGAVHDIHHQPCGIKYNFSNPFFVTWDKLLGTYMPYTIEKRKNGKGLEVRPVKKLAMN